MIDAKVEIGLDLGDASDIAFRLDDAVKGKLDNTEYVLGGLLFYDISNRVQSITTRRGKNEALDRIDAGTSSITLDNSDRFFDPLYPNGPYYGSLVPRREIKISADNKPVFYGLIEDFDLNYQPGNRATTNIEVSDAFSILANSQIAELTPPSELSGARVSRVLDLPEVNWSPTARDIDAGNTVLLDSEVLDQSAIEYLQTVANSEFGNLFIGKNGDLVFKQRNSNVSSPDLIFTDDLSPSSSIKIPYSSIQAIYGSENLFTKISLANTDVIPDTVTVENATSSALYGVRSYTDTSLLVQSATELQYLADFLLGTYQTPLYRFESVSVVIDKLDATQTAAVLDLEIGDIVQVRFQPSGIPPAIELPARIIGISHTWEPSIKRVSYSLETLNFGVFVLDSPLLGRLDDDRLGY